MAKPFARTNFRRIDNKIKRPRAATSSIYEPGKLPAAYGMPVGVQVKPGVIVIYELGGKFYPSDVAKWAAKSGLPAPTVNIKLLSGADDSSSDADGEVALDWQKAAEFWSYMTGLPANILIVYGPNSGPAFADCVNYTNTLANVLAGSWSWGQEEDQWAAGDLSSLLAACNAAPYPVTAASGDNDSSDGSNASVTDAPSCLPVIVASGGTSFPPGGSEVVWNNGGGEGTGGGFSKLYGRPAWQPANSQGTGRMVPDMAMDADPNTGHDTVINGEWEIIGGTSAVAPMMAGLLAVANGSRLFQGMTILGPGINSSLWASSNCFFDITNGNNGAYSATVGPDPCTGFGRPLGTLVSSLAGAPTPVPPVPPPSPPPPPVPPPSPPPPPPVGNIYEFQPFPLFRGLYQVTSVGGSPALPHGAFYATVSLSQGANVTDQQKAAHIHAMMLANPQINWGPILASLAPVILQILQGLLSGSTPTAGS